MWTLRSLMIFSFLLLSYLPGFALAIEKTTTFIKIDLATATSIANLTIAGGKQYAPENALSRGSRMWCSSGGHSSDQAVQWAGSLVTPRKVKGVKINWGYAPGEFMIETSFDGEKFEPTITWTKNNKKEESFAQDVLFPQSLKIRSIRVSMKSPIHGYYGINFAALISDGHTLVLLTSGITSSQGEMCLQVEAGKKSVGTSVVLDTCVSAIAAGDGREIWRFSDTAEIIHVMSKLCLTLKDNNEQKREIVIAECQTFADGRANWEILPNSQLKSLRNGDFCLTQEGSRSGSADMALEKMTYTTFPRAGDKLHTAQKAFDGDPSTYFATQEFDSGALPEAVDLKVDLGGVFKVLRSEIDWMFPASRFNILLSTNSTNYKLASSTVANSMNTTINDLQGTEARYVQLQMLEPHPTYSVHDNKAVYGIIRFSVYVNRLRSTIEPCVTALKSTDGRDKYFVTFVSEFDQVSGTSVVQKGKDYLTSTSKLEDLGTALESKRGDFESCYKNLKSKAERLRIDRASLSETKSKYLLAQAGFMDTVEEYSSTDGSKIVEVISDGEKPPELPEDCTDILLVDPFATDGYFDVHPTCSPGPLRVYCDFKTHMGLYIYHGSPPYEPGTILTRDLWRPEEVLKRCKALDMRPFVLTTPDQAFRIQTVLKHMRFKTENNTNAVVPVGVVKPDGTTNALDLKTDISTTVAGVPRSNPSLTSIGIGWHAEALTYIDWKTSEIIGALCETHQSIMLQQFVLSRKVIDVDCNEAPRNNHKFEGCPFTWLLARCPNDCKQMESDVIYGLDTYRDDSPICLASRQADGIGKHNLVNVTFMPGMGSYEGAMRNGIRSRPYIGAVWDRSFRATKPGRSCPNTTESETKPSFLQIPDASTVIVGADKRTFQHISRPPSTRSFDLRFSQIRAEEPVSSVKVDMSEMKNVTDATEDVANLVLRFIENVGGVSPELTRKIAEKAFETMSWARGILKPSEEIDKKVQGESVVLDEQSMATIKTMFSVQSKVFDALTDYDNRLERIQNKKARLWGFKTFQPPNLMELLTSAFWKFFQRLDPLVTDPLVNSLSKTGHRLAQGSWYMATSVAAMVGREGFGVFAYLDEDSLHYNKSVPVVNREPIVVQNKGIFDGVLTLDFNIEKGTGSFAVAFRMKDEQNAYIYEVRQERGIKRLMKVIDGQAIQLSTRNDGGYLSNVWYSLRIELKMNRIEISSGISGTKLKNVFAVLDGTHITGTVGFIAIGVDMYIDRFSFIANRCAETGVSPPPPLPPYCSIYQHREIWGFDTQWHAVQPPKAHSKGVWEFKRDVSGRSNVIVQYTAVTGTENQHGTIAVLKRHRYCTEGIFSADFFPQCDGLVGLVVHYGGPQSFVIVEFGPDLVRLRRMGDDGEFSDLSSVTVTDNPSAKYNLGQWNSALVSFNLEHVNVTLNNGRILDAALSKIDLPAGGRVGLSAWRCGGVGFDKVSLQPPAILPVDLLEEPSPKDSTEKSKPEEKDSMSSNSSPSTFVATRTNGNEETWKETHMSSCQAPHIIEREVECKKLLGNEADNSLALIECKYNYCDVCCSKSVASFFGAKGLKGIIPQTAFQFDMFREKVAALRARCLLECAKKNRQALATSDLLASVTKTCSANVIEKESVKPSRQRNRDFMAAWEALDALESDKTDKEIGVTCQTCCNSEAAGDSKIANACQMYCSKGKTTVDWNNWQFLSSAITMAEM